MTSSIESNILSSRIEKLSDINLPGSKFTSILSVRVVVTKKMGNSVDRKRIKRRILNAVLSIGLNIDGILIQKESKVKKISSSESKNIANTSGKQSECVAQNMMHSTCKHLILKIFATREILYVKYGVILNAVENMMQKNLKFAAKHESK